MRAWRWASVITVVLCLWVSSHARPPASVVNQPVVTDVPWDAGTALEIRWLTELSSDYTIVLLRAHPNGQKDTVGHFPADQLVVIDQGLTPQFGYTYELYLYDAQSNLMSNTSTSTPVAPLKNGFDRSKLSEFIIVLLIFSLLLWASWRRTDVYVRPIAGLKAMEDAIGRAVEMGRPVLFSAGWGAQLDKPTTLAAMNIFGWIARKSAEYGADLRFPAHDAIIMSAAQESAQEASLLEGKPEWYIPEHISYVTGSQFGYAAALDGIMERERPATNLWLGTFAAESLILAETGNHVGAVQIAGTDSTIQLAFFLVTCDYTLIGEEVFAASGYLTRDPRVLGGLWAQDMFKIVMAVGITVGLIGASLGWTQIGDWLRQI
jgi:hypothetical protein